MLMRIALAAGFALCIGSSVLVVLSARQARSEPPAVDARSLARLEERIGTIAGRLGELDELRRTVEGIASRPVTQSAPTARSASTPDASASNVAADADSSTEPGKEPPIISDEGLARLLGVHGGEEALRQYVAEVYLATRDERKARERREAEERAREEALLHEGPYGEFNYTVNSMGKKLDLNDWQKQSYHNLLQNHARGRADLRARQEAAMKQATSPEQMKQLAADFRPERRAIDERFEQGFISLLDADQATTYEEHGESAGGRTVHVSDAVQGIELRSGLLKLGVQNVQVDFTATDSP